MAVTDVFARRADVRRSVRLLSEFRYEQRDPARFYGTLATDTVALVSDLWRSAHGESPAGRTLLDVGGGPGYFAAAFAGAGVRYIGVEPDPREMHAAGPVLAGEAHTFVRASGMALPFADDSVDICLSSNVAEHVPRPWQLGGEMLRVTRPGGLAVLSYTVWLGPFGGHEMGPTHYLGGARAAARLSRMTDQKADPPRQLPLDLGHGTGYSRDELVVSGTNTQAVALVDRWPDWPSPVVVLAGPAGSGG